MIYKLIIHCLQVQNLHISFIPRIPIPANNYTIPAIHEYNTHMLYIAWN